MRLGITGHRDLPRDALGFLRQEIRQLIDRAESPVAVSSLAVGADQLFAREVLAARGALEAIVPSEDYRMLFNEYERPEYDALLACASRVFTLPFSHGNEQAFMQAGRAVVESCELLVAVWDGAPAGGLGGTADVVDYAKSVGREVTIVWPGGLGR